jgi:hypothetical protein
MIRNLLRSRRGKAASILIEDGLHLGNEIRFGKLLGPCLQVSRANLGL